MKKLMLSLLCLAFSLSVVMMFGCEKGNTGSSVAEIDSSDSGSVADSSGGSGTKPTDDDDTPSGNLDYFNFDLQADGTYSVAVSSKGSLNAKDLVIPRIYNGADVTRIRESGFAYVRDVESITIPESITSIGKTAFEGCNMLSVVYWNAVDCAVEVQSAPWGEQLIFAKSEKLKSIIFGENVRKIPGNAFCYCDRLSSISIPKGVTSIGNYAFNGCSGLTSITIPDSVTSIGDSAFSGCGGLTSVTIPDSVTSIGDHAFLGCSGLKTVYYKGTKEQKNSISIGSDNNNLTSATWYYYSETEPALNAEGTDYDGNYWHYADDGITPVVWKKE